MSPFHERWFDVESPMRRKVEERAEETGLDIESLINSRGFLFLVNRDGVSKVARIDDVTDGVLKDARKETSHWHLVKGLFRKSVEPLNKKFRDISSDEANLRKGWLPGSKYRGNHRSHTKHGQAIDFLVYRKRVG